MQTARGILATVAALALVASACGNSPSGEAGDDDGGGADGDDGAVTVDQPGVTDDTIRVGGVASVTNPLGGNYGDVFAGAQAYFDMVNSEGGVHGRQIDLVSERDDQVASNQAEVQGLLAQDDIFAAVPMASLLFTGADLLVEENVPTFGWNINPEFGGPENLYGEKGSFICFTCPHPLVPWFADENGLENVAVLAYGNSAQSAECAEGYVASFAEFGDAEVVFEDTSLAFGVPDMKGQVREMANRDVDLVLTCMDQTGVNTLAEDMNEEGLDAIQYLPNAYDPDFVEEFGDVFEGSFVAIEFWPFEVTEDAPEGMADYLRWTEETGAPRNEISMAGWLSAQLFVTGLREAGPDFTRQKVIDSLNELDSWTADGLLPGVDWTIEHTEENPESCFALVEIVDGEFVPRFGEPGKPFVCIANDAEELPDEPQRRG
ncbi:MAG: ABC transporter substrate-binding protein [Acidimicrobiia bacterium]|nr:ABC transporter substrate-binding protein [Acidimicrobiia bacterium]